MIKRFMAVGLFLGTVTCLYAFVRLTGTGAEESDVYEFSNKGQTQVHIPSALHQLIQKECPKYRFPQVKDYHPRLVGGIEVSTPFLAFDDLNEDELLDFAVVLISSSGTKGWALNAFLQGPKGHFERYQLSTGVDQWEQYAIKQSHVSQRCIEMLDDKTIQPVCWNGYDFELKEKESAECPDGCN